MKISLKQSLLRESTQSQFLTDETEIRAWLESMKLKSSFEIQDGEVIVHGGLNLHDKTLDVIPVKFKSVDGDIDVSCNKLTRIDWAPKIVSGSFEAWDNNIETLENGPEEVKKNFDVDNNKLTSLKGGPKIVNGSYICSDNDLSQGLDGCPQHVGGYFKAASCGITKLDVLPVEIGSNVYVQNNKITSFRGVAKLIKKFGFIEGRDGGKGLFNIGGNPIENGLASIAAIKGIKGIAGSFSDKEIEKAIKLVNTGLNQGKDAIEIQELLDESGMIKIS